MDIKKELMLSSYGSTNITANVPTLGIVAQTRTQTNYKQTNNVKRNTNGNYAKRVLCDGFKLIKI